MGGIAVVDVGTGRETTLFEKMRIETRRIETRRINKLTER